MAALVCAAGCTQLTDGSGPVLLEGFRGSGDACRRVAETRYAARFPRFTGDLVACPATMPGLARFAARTGALAVDRPGDLVVYAVPRG